jgi:hypothetical protein
MTKLKIKEDTSRELKELDVSELKSGDMLYSYEYDTLVMIVDTPDGLNCLVDLSDSQIVSEDDHETFDSLLEYYNDNFGPFFLVRKAKINFKI